MSTLETEYDSHQFFVMDIIVPFCWKKTLQMECNWVEPVFVFLLDDYS